MAKKFLDKLDEIHPNSKSEFFFLVIVFGVALSTNLIPYLGKLAVALGAAPGVTWAVLDIKKRFKGQLSVKNKLQLLLVFLILAFTFGQAFAQNSLNKDQQDACSVVLCLSSSVRPGECTPPLQRYFSINLSKPWETVAARLNFLRMCPATNDGGDMSSLAVAIANGAGKCDPASLNQTLASYDSDNNLSSINNQMPGYCSAYLNNKLVDLKNNSPVYVGTPATGGFWVEASAYPAAVSAYNTRMNAWRSGASQSSGD